MTPEMDFQSRLAAAETAMSVLTPDPRLRQNYDRVALISHPRHLERLDGGDASLLVVATEWLAWWAAREGGYAVLHYESRLAPWPDDLGSPDYLYLRACDWIYADGADMTEYKAVSLGYMFGTPTALAWVAYRRLEYALSQICRDVRPRELILFDLSSHFSILGAPEKRQLAADLARHHDLSLVDHLDPLTPEDPHCQTTPLHAGSGAETGARPWLRRAYGHLIGAVSRIVWWLQGRRPKVFIFASHQTSLSLIRHFRGRRIAPVFLAGALPKNPVFLWNCWRRGIVLARLPGPRRRGRAVREIVEAIDAQWRREGAEDAEAARRTYIRDRFLGSGRIDALAGLVDRFDRLFGQHQFERVVSGDVGNPAGLAICTLTHVLGIPSDETLNGMFISNLRDPSRCGDAIKGPTLSRELAFGDVTVEWMKATASPVDYEITGYPALDAVRERFGNKPHGPQRRNALVLPGYAYLADATALSAEIVPFLINSVRVLARHGFDAIRIKLHPAGENRHFFEYLIDRFDLPATVHDDGNFLDHLDWADAVVGPATTGAFVETLAAGKPYYVFHSAFSAVPVKYLRSATVVSSASELDSVLASRTEPDIDTILDDFCAVHTVSNASERMWQILEDSIPQGHPATRTTEPPVFKAERPAAK